MSKIKIFLAIAVVFIVLLSIIFQNSHNLTRSSLTLPNDSVPILMYHKVSPASLMNGPGMRVSPGQFEKQMRYLSQSGYNTISLDQLYDHWDNGTTLPKQPVVITFDDGYEDNYIFAFPVLKKYKQKATIFLVYNEIGGYNEWDAKTNPARRLRLLSWPQIYEMQKNGISFESHTLTHPRLSEISPQTASTEIILSKAKLGEALGKPVNFIAYPYGKSNKEVREIVRKAGYRAAVTTMTGTNTPNDDRFYLKRLRINANVSINEFKQMAETHEDI